MILPRDELAERARRQCERTMKDLFEGEVRPETVQEATEWDANLHRNLHRHDFAVWKEYDQLEVAVDAEGKVVSFLDKNRMKPAAPPEFQKLEDKDVLAIAGTTGLLGTSARVRESTLGPGNMLVARIEQAESGRPRGIRFTINPALKHVAAFEVEEERR